ncbi:hypothetical protein DFH06DRAFT_1367132 [Mycena polygramma]|nr:hypothetical protein DFH06DRAFT_1367132 [Mycena polygramma]
MVEIRGDEDSVGTSAPSQTRLGSHGIHSALLLPWAIPKCAMHSTRTNHRSGTLPANPALPSPSHAQSHLVANHAPSSSCLPEDPDTPDPHPVLVRCHHAVLLGLRNVALGDGVQDDTECRMMRTRARVACPLTLDDGMDGLFGAQTVDGKKIFPATAPAFPAACPRSLDAWIDAAPSLPAIRRSPHHVRLRRALDAVYVPLRLLVASLPAHTAKVRGDRSARSACAAALLLSRRAPCTRLRVILTPAFARISRWRARVSSRWNVRITEWRAQTGCDGKISSLGETAEKGGDRRTRPSHRRKFVFLVIGAGKVLPVLLGSVTCEIPASLVDIKTYLALTGIDPQNTFRCPLLVLHSYRRVPGGEKCHSSLEAPPLGITSDCDPESLVPALLFGETTLDRDTTTS